MASNVHYRFETDNTSYLFKWLNGSYTENGHKLRISGKENEGSDKIGE